MLFHRLSDRLRHHLRLRRENPAHAWGKRGEDLAHRYLQRKKYTVIGRNYRSPGGHAEVDLIALDGEVVVFVEVKTRKNDEFGSPESAVDGLKRRKIQRGAEDFMRRSGREEAAIRFDVVSVLFDSGERIEHLPDAFGIDRAY